MPAVLWTVAKVLLILLAAVLGLVLFVSDGADGKPTGETEYKLAQTIAAFLGRHMEG